MDIITYALSKKIAAHALSGVQSMSINGQTLIINTKDSGVLTITFPTPKDGVSVIDIDVNANNQIVFTMSDGSEIISGKIPTVKGDKGDPGVSPIITENADNTDKIYKLDITTADSTFTTPNLKGADGQGGSGETGEENTIDSISINGVNVVPDENKNVDITVPNIYVGDTEPIDDNMEVWINPSGESSPIEVPIEKIKVNGELQTPVNKVVDITVPDAYDDTQIKTQIQTVANGLMDSVGYSADYKTIDVIAKNGVKKSIDVAPIISHASITELSDIDTTNKATGKALVYNATTSKHEYADVSSTDEKVKMDASTDAKYLGELLDNVTIANENGKLKVKKLDGQEVTITEINYLKGLTMNVMDLVNMFSNGGVKIINTPVATYAELLTIDKSSFIEGISYLVYVLTDENHDNAKTTYLVDKDSETPTYFGFADSQRDFTTNPIDLATEITGKLGIANMDSDAIKALFTVDDTYKTETTTNNAFGTHGAKALYDELLLAIGNKANNSDLTAHKDDADIHVSTTEKDNWNGKADASDLTAHTGDSVIHVTAENKTLWNTVSNKVNKEDGKALLADTDKANYDDAVTKAHTHENKEVLDGITSDKVTAWDNKSEFSGSYNDLNDKPTIDAELSNTSENAIQNKVVTKEINKLYSDISFNDFDTATDGISFTDAEDGNMLVADCTRNLLNPTLETSTVNGVTCTNNGDGTYTINGTSTKDYWISFGSITLNPGKYKFIATENNVEVNNLCVALGHTSIATPGSKFTIQSKSVCNIGLSTFNETFNNVLIKPMITTDLDATYDDFVPYSGYDIKTCGKNLLNVDMPTKTQNGITCTNNGDGTYTLNGTATADTLFSLVKFLNNRSALYKKIVGKNVLFINGGHKYNSNYRILFNVSNSDYTKWGLERYDGDSFVVPSGYEIAVVDIHVNSGATVNNLVVKPMITFDLDATNDDFEPYQDGGTVHVDSSTEFPLLGLKSFDGETNIISPANVKAVYPTNESGKGVLDSLYNKDKMLTEQNKSLEVLGKCKNLLNPTLQTTTKNGVTCTNNGDGTYTLNGTNNNESEILFSLNNIMQDVFCNKLKKIGGTFKVLLHDNNYDDNVNGGIVVAQASKDWSKWYGETKNGEVLILNDNTGNIAVDVHIKPGITLDNVLIKPMITTDLSATYDDFVPYTGDGDTLTHDVAEIKNDLGGLSFSASGTTLSITDGTNTWTLGANS